MKGKLDASRREELIEQGAVCLHFVSNMCCVVKYFRAAVIIIFDIVNNLNLNFFFLTVQSQSLEHIVL